MNHIYLILILIICLLSCQNEPNNAAGSDENGLSSDTSSTKEADAAATLEEVVKENPAKEIRPELLYIQEHSMQLVDRKSIPLPKIDTDTTVVFFIRQGKNIEGKTSLTMEGKMQSSRLANIFRDAKLKTVYWGDNAAMQTGFHTSQANESELLNYRKKENYKLLELIQHNDKGKRVMVIDDQFGIPDMLNRLLNENKFFPIEETDYDQVYVAYLLDQKVLDIWDLRFYKIQ